MGSCSNTTTFVFAIVITVLSISYGSSILVEAQKQVPCLFFFGDSQSDNGNNNGLPTLAKVNYNPYGIDFPGGATGRFANGPNIPDYLAKFLGFTNSIPPYVTASDPTIVNGVNYASGGAGILDSTGIQLGARFTMNEQLASHQFVTYRIASLQGRSPTSVRNDYLSKCIYVVNIGSNDYINNYLLQLSPTRPFYPNPENFAQYLIQEFSRQLRNLYSQGARKIAVFGIGLLGCLPSQIAAANANGCVASVNNMVQLFNNKVKPLIDSLNSELSNSRFTYINITSISSGDPSVIGVTVANTPCCPVSSITGLCIPNSVPCSNRSEYTFWDNFHPTSILNNVTAARAYSAAQPADATPFDIRRLAQQ